MTARRMPHRRVLRGVVQDAIDDRTEYVDACRGDAGLTEATQALIARYETLMTRLSNPAPLGDADKRLLARATGHARIWRTGLVESWRKTGDKAHIKICRDDMSRLETVERALGVTPSWLHGGPDPEGVTTVSVMDLSRRRAAA